MACSWCRCQAGRQWKVNHTMGEVVRSWSSSGQSLGQMPIGAEHEVPRQPPQKGCWLMRMGRMSPLRKKKEELDVAEVTG